MDYFTFENRESFEAKHGKLSDKMDLFAGDWWIAVDSEGKFFARDTKPMEWGKKDKARTIAVLKPRGK